MSTTLDTIGIPGVDDGDRAITDDVVFYGPPGTGKTTTCAALIARLIRDEGYRPGEICWITYRKDLAVETIDRLINWGVLAEEERNHLLSGATRFMGTIHAIGNRSVGGLNKPATYGNKVGFSKMVGLDFNAPVPWEDGDGELLFDAFQWMKNNCLDPGDPADVAAAETQQIEDFQDQCGMSIPSLWQRWEAYKVDRDLIDYADQLRIPVERNTPCPRPVLVVDEFHDAYPLMAKLCQQWIDDAEIAIVAGDPDQVVNNYTGASPEFFNGLDMPTQLLGTSWRVPERHWDLATDILSLAPGHAPPAVETPNPGGEIYHHDTPGIFESHRERDHGDIGRWSVPRREDGHPGIIAVKHADGGNDLDGPGYGKDPDSVLFLTRTRKQAQGISAALDDCGVIYTSQEGAGGWASHKGSSLPKRRRLFDAFQTIHGFDPNLTSDLYPGTLSLSSAGDSDAKAGFEMDPTTVAYLIEATDASYHCYDGTKKGMVKSLKNRKNKDFVDEREFCSWVEAAFWGQATDGAASLGLINDSYLADREQIALARALARHAGAGPIGSGDIGISVLTIHASKGHEARDVVIYEGVTKSIDDAMRTNSEDCANEYRTWYVATSRAQERLHIAHGGFDWIYDIPGQPLSRENTPTEGR